MPCAMKLLDSADPWTGRDENSCAGGIVPFPEVASEIGLGALIVEGDFGGSVLLDANSVLLLRAPIWAAGTFVFARSAAGGDIRTNPAMSSNVGAPSDGLVVSSSGVAAPGASGGATGTGGCEVRKGRGGGERSA